MTSARSRLLCIYTLVLLGAFAPSVAAQETPKNARKTTKRAPSKAPVEGVVVHVQNGEIVLDLGREDGLKTGGEVQLYRRLEVTHPVTKKKVVDRFPSGTIVVDDVGARLSISRQKEGFKTPPKEGDIVVLYPPPAPLLAEEPTPQDAPDVRSMDPVRADVEATFTKTLGQPLPERIALWEEILKKHPKSSYTESVGREVVWLRLKLSEERRMTERAERVAKTRKRDANSPLEARVAGPRVVDYGAIFALSASISRPDLVQAVRVLVRKQGDVQYTTYPMKKRGDFIWILELGVGTGARTLDVGAWEYFVEVVRTNGELLPIRGEPKKPESLKVRSTVAAPAARIQRSLARTRFDWVDFKIGDGKDQYTRFETDYRYRINSLFLEYIRVGVGVFEGTSTPVASIERGDTTDTTTKTTAYGFFEGELPFGDWVGLSGRILLGNQSTSGRDTLQSALGFRSELRLGKLDETNLRIGGSLTEGLGNEAWLQLSVDTIHRLPMIAEATVTNLPADGDLGVMLNYSIGYDITPWFTPMVRVGWNARTINHQGATAGLDMRLAW